MTTQDQNNYSLDLDGMGKMQVKVDGDKITMVCPKESGLQPGELAAFIYLINSVDRRKLNGLMAELLSTYMGQRPKQTVPEWLDFCRLQQFAERLSYAE